MLKIISLFYNFVSYQNAWKNVFIIKLYLIYQVTCIIFNMGFLKATVLLLSYCVLHGIGKILDKSGQVNLIYMHYAKTFNTVPHSGILLKLFE